MGTIIEFPADAASRRLASTMGAIKQATRGTVVILPVIRIERQVESVVEETSGGRGPEEGTAPRRRRRRR
jgi:hypothetical protein